MSEFVRVSLPESKTHATVSKAWAESAGLRIVKEPATHYGGRPLAPTTYSGRAVKPRTTVQDAAESKAAEQGGVAADPKPEEASK